MAVRPPRARACEGVMWDASGGASRVASSGAVRVGSGQPRMVHGEMRATAAGDVGGGVQAWEVAGDGEGLWRAQSPVAAKARGACVRGMRERWVAAPESGQASSGSGDAGRRGATGRSSGKAAQQGARLRAWVSTGASKGRPVHSRRANRRHNGRSSGQGCAVVAYGVNSEGRNRWNGERGSPRSLWRAQ